jgi:hypothetical protein
MDLDASAWSGEGELTQRLIEAIGALHEVASLRVEDAPATRADSLFSFISNEMFVLFSTIPRTVRTRKFGLIPASSVVQEKAMTLGALEASLAADPVIGAPDYADEGMLQYLRAERIIPPYQTRGYKVVELVRIYEAGTKPRGDG